MDTAASAPSDLPRQSGFNLIEAAIVLGVVGLVIGGIWIAAASVSMKMNTNAQGIRSLPADICTIVSNCTTQVASGYVGFYFRP